MACESIVLVEGMVIKREELNVELAWSVVPFNVMAPFNTPEAVALPVENVTAGVVK